jgi:hypothetical protein
MSVFKWNDEMTSWIMPRIVIVTVIYHCHKIIDII